MSVTLEVLYVRDCPNAAPLMAHLRAATDLPFTAREITDAADAAAAGMCGSPTVLINGRDPFTSPSPQASDCGMSCRIYRDEHGQTVPAPSVARLRDAVASAAASSRDIACCDPPRPEMLSAWRTRALPLDLEERAMHQAILRTFAATGRPPATGDLHVVAAGRPRATADVLAALHELDAIRLAPDGQIAVAYPFSAAPTRHRVTIGDHVEVHAMCAIDALGMAAMLDQDVRIDSVDVTTGYPVSVVMSDNASTWDPAEAVVFIGAVAAGGPSADSCCDYINFFTGTAAAQAWSTAHPHVPGQILTQAEAEDLGARLFAPLFAAP